MKFSRLHGVLILVLAPTMISCRHSTYQDTNLLPTRTQPPSAQGGQPDLAFIARHGHGPSRTCATPTPTTATTARIKRQSNDDATTGKSIARPTPVESFIFGLAEVEASATETTSDKYSRASPEARPSLTNADSTRSRHDRTEPSAQKIIYVVIQRQEIIPTTGRIWESMSKTAMPHDLVASTAQPTTVLGASQHIDQRYFPARPGPVMYQMARKTAMPTF